MPQISKFFVAEDGKRRTRRIGSANMLRPRRAKNSAFYVLLRKKAGRDKPSG